MSNRSKQEDDEDEDDDGLKPPKPTPVKELPYFDSLRILLEPYRPAANLPSASETFSTGELISALEQHHGVPQGLRKGDVVQWVMPGDFVRAMHHLGFREENAGGIHLVWAVIRK